MFSIGSFLYYNYYYYYYYQITTSYLLPLSYPLFWLTDMVPEGDKLMVIHSCLFCALLRIEGSSSCTQSLMLFIPDFFGLPLFIPSGTVPCSIVFERVLCLTVWPNNFRFLHLIYFSRGSKFYISCFFIQNLFIGFPLSKKYQGFFLSMLFWRFWILLLLSRLIVETCECRDSWWTSGQVVKNPEGVQWLGNSQLSTNVDSYWIDQFKDPTTRQASDVVSYMFAGKFSPNSTILGEAWPYPYKLSPNRTTQLPGTIFKEAWPFPGNCFFLTVPRFDQDYFITRKMAGHWLWTTSAP